MTQLGGTQWGSVIARFGPGPSVFMFTALTPQWRVDILITQQFSQANMMGWKWLSCQNCRKEKLLKSIHNPAMFLFQKVK